MEGYLFKKGRGQSGFLGRKNWKKRWCVLEGQYLTYYEDFDKKTQKPTEKKGMVPVRGCTVEECKKGEKKFQFVLKHETRSSLFMSAEDEKMMKIWIQALDRAAKTNDGPTNIDFSEYYEIFGLNMADNPTASQLNRAYRKTCLKCHPDKGGDANEFKRVQEAFEILTTKFEEEEEDKLYQTVEFDAVIEKGPPGIGFGMVVSEDTKKQVIKVKEVLKTMNLKSIQSEGRGTIKKDDILIKIGDDVIAGWTLTRIVQRLNDFRVPVNSDIQLRFSRRRKIVEDEPEQSEFQDIDEDVHQRSGDAAHSASQAPPPSAPTGGMHDIDEDEYQRPASNEPTQEKPPSPKQGPSEDMQDIDEEEKVFDNQSDYAYDQRVGESFDDAEDFEVAEGAWEDVMKDPLRRATIESAGEDLRAEFEEMSKTLRDVIAQRDKIKMEMSELKDIIRQQRAEKKELLKQLELAEKDCEEAERSGADALLQLKEISFQNQQSKEEAGQIMKEAANIASLLKRNKEIPVPKDFEIYLDRSGYSHKNIKSQTMNAQRTALRAAAAIDKKGSVMRKWSLEGDSAIEKLKKFEFRLNQQLERNTSHSSERRDTRENTNDQDTMNATGGMNQPHEYDENMFSSNHEMDAPESNDVLMRRVMAEQQQQQQQQTVPVIPRRPAPSRPVPRADYGHPYESAAGGHYNSRNDGAESLRQQHYKESTKQQPYQPFPYQHPGAEVVKLSPNPLFSGASNNYSARKDGNPAQGSKIMGLLERKLANRSNPNGFAPPAMESQQRRQQYIPPPHSNRSPNEPPRNIPQQSSLQPHYNGNRSPSFRGNNIDDQSEGSGFGWHGMMAN